MKRQPRKIPGKWKRYLILLLLIATGGILNLSFSQVQAPTISITILYDNYPFRQGLKTGQGFSCLIQGTEKTVLFDAGGKDTEGLFHNFSALKIDPKDVDLIVISQAQPDKVSGLLAFLAKKGECLVFLPASTSPDLIKQIEKAKGRVELVTNPVSVCEGVFSTGRIGTEQALVVDTPKGLIILTGCARTPMVDVVEKARSVMPKDVYLLMGGFNLGEQNETALSPIVRKLREQGVKNLGATHCTGEKAIAVLKNNFGKNYIALGAGKAIFVQ